MTPPFKNPAPSRSARDSDNGNGTLDQINRQIIHLLETDGRMTNRAIAQAVGVSEPDIAKRLRGMKSSGAMTTSVFTGLRSFGWGLNALLRISIAVNRRDEAQRALLNIENLYMLFVCRAFGRYDFIGSIAARDIAQFREIIEDRLSHVPGFEGFELHLGLEALRLSSFIGVVADAAASQPNLPLSAEATAGRFDELDIAIIRDLMDDSRRPFVAIADALDVSEATIRRRVARMTEEGAIRFGPLVNPTAFGLPWTTIAWIDVEATRMRAVVDSLSQMRSVQGLFSIAGPLGNLYASLHGDHARSIPELIETRIACLPGVRRVTTQESLRLVKYSSHWREMQPNAAREQPLPLTRSRSRAPK